MEEERALGLIAHRLTFNDLASFFPFHKTPLEWTIRWLVQRDCANNLGSKSNFFTKYDINANSIENLLKKFELIAKRIYVEGLPLDYKNFQYECLACAITLYRAPADYQTIFRLSAEQLRQYAIDLLDKPGQQGEAAAYFLIAAHHFYPVLSGLNKRKANNLLSTYKNWHKFQSADLIKAVEYFFSCLSLEKAKDQSLFTPACEAIINYLVHIDYDFKSINLGNIPTHNKTVFAKWINPPITQYSFTQNELVKFILQQWSNKNCHLQENVLETVLDHCKNIIGDWGFRKFSNQSLPNSELKNSMVDLKLEEEYVKRIFAKMHLAKSIRPSKTFSNTESILKQYRETIASSPETEKDELRSDGFFHIFFGKQKPTKLMKAIVLYDDELKNDSPNFDNVFAKIFSFANGPGIDDFQCHYLSFIHYLFQVINFWNEDDFKLLAKAVFKGIYMADNLVLDNYEKIYKNVLRLFNDFHYDYTKLLAEEPLAVKLAFYKVHSTLDLAEMIFSSPSNFIGDLNSQINELSYEFETRQVLLSKIVSHCQQIWYKESISYSSPSEYFLLKNLASIFEEIQLDVDIKVACKAMLIRPKNIMDIDTKNINTCIWFSLVYQNPSQVITTIKSEANYIKKICITSYCDLLRSIILMNNLHKLDCGFSVISGESLHFLMNELAENWIEACKSNFFNYQGIYTFDDFIAEINNGAIYIQPEIMGQKIINSAQINELCSSFGGFRLAYFADKYFNNYPGLAEKCAYLLGLNIEEEVNGEEENTLDDNIEKLEIAEEHHLNSLKI